VYSWSQQRKRHTGTWIEAKQKIDGGPSVLYDAVAILTSSAGAGLLTTESTARDFVADAFAHCKPEAIPPGDGCFELSSSADARTFLKIAPKSGLAARAEREIVWIGEARIIKALARRQQSTSA
jgi:hypothetical protein